MDSLRIVQLYLLIFKSLLKNLTEDDVEQSTDGLIRKGDACWTKVSF